MIFQAGHGLLFGALGIIVTGKVQHPVDENSKEFGFFVFTQFCSLFCNARCAAVYGAFNFGVVREFVIAEGDYISNIAAIQVFLIDAHNFLFIGKNQLKQGEPAGFLHANSVQNKSGFIIRKRNLKAAFIENLKG